jgi:RecT family
MNRDPRFALSQVLEAKQPLLDQLRARATDDPDFFTDLIEGETNLLELIVDASIVDDEILADGVKIALDKLQARKRSAENRIEFKRRRLAQSRHQSGRLRQLFRPGLAKRAWPMVPHHGRGPLGRIRAPQDGLGRQSADRAVLDKSGRWADMPFPMLAKCAEAQAIRRGWPEDTSATPLSAKRSSGRRSP